MGLVDDTLVAAPSGTACQLRDSSAGVCLDGTCIEDLCGDGFASPSEECDDGELSNLYVPNRCRPDCTLPRCGDGLVDPEFNEVCDPLAEGLGGVNCSPECEIDRCGNGFVGEQEECDDGNTSNTDDCLNDCRIGFCGDGFTREGVEGCDDGNTIDNDACRNDCAPATCGNSAVEEFEACDDGNSDPTDDCLNTCQLARCGDGFVREGIEECDNGPNNGVPGRECSLTCLSNRCGDGYLGDGEACDNGEENGVVGNSCTTECRSNGCGDGSVGEAEQCDSGTNNGLPGDRCKIDCFLNRCGDTHLGPLEQCDDGEQNGTSASSCTSVCAINVCGDATVGSGEECDNGQANGEPGNECTVACQVNDCGDLLVSADEECDNGPNVGVDGSPCTAQCTLNICGDGHIGPNEDCDLGTDNGEPDQPCSSECRGVEICDGLDNDLDEIIDNGNPGGGAPCLNDGGSFPNPPEICTNDNECNTAQGRFCDLTSNRCRLVGQCVAGITECNSELGVLRCVPNIAPASQLEICDTLDNDCDGDFDEIDGFRYTDVDGDGFGDPATETATCPFPDTAVDRAGDCADMDGSINPDAADEPDSGDVDSNCDGIDGDLDRAIFVSTTGSDSNNGRGSFDGTALTVNPLRSLESAVFLASQCDPTCAVYVSEGVYNLSATLELRAGVDVVGGYTSSWAHTLDRSAVVLTGDTNPIVRA
ncbi:MAG: DUF4215 domain-containing protein, partial [Myxococcota bacterium]